MKTDLRNISEFPIVLTVEDVAKIMNISRVTAYNLVHSEGFPCKHIGRRLIIAREAFFNWLNSTNVYSTAAALMIKPEKANEDTSNI